MRVEDEKTPRPDQVEKDITDFLTKKYGGSVRVLGPMAMTQEDGEQEDPKKAAPRKAIRFDLKPEELCAYLDQYIVRQDRAKAVLATKICTHYNRVAKAMAAVEKPPEIAGGVKNNVLLMGPTGVGKTYLLKLIARKIGVPFVKGDATKFSETGYVGGDVEDLVRDLVREADGDVELAQYGIIYLDEVDKIAGAQNLVGIDVSRSGVQRALLKPMEETDVDLRSPNDPMSMMQEFERMRRGEKKSPSRVNTKNILFIMSGAFNDMARIVKKRLSEQGIGFSASVGSTMTDAAYLHKVRAEDLVAYGFESEFIGRLPVMAVLDELSEDDLFEILKNPNNPIVLSKKLDFAAYGIRIVFTDPALRAVARDAANHKTGARGLVSAMERALLCFEKKLPSTDIKTFTVTGAVAKDPEAELARLLENPDDPAFAEAFSRADQEERAFFKQYLACHWDLYASKFGLALTETRKDLLSSRAMENPSDLEALAARLARDLDRVGSLSERFFTEHGIELILDDPARDHVLAWAGDQKKIEDYYPLLTQGFLYGCKLLGEKKNKKSFDLNATALQNPEAYLSVLIKEELSNP
ncbi:MAG: AAA family ATPase [Thermodesulfobacteriota bacterium]